MGKGRPAVKEPLSEFIGSKVTEKEKNDFDFVVEHLGETDSKHIRLAVRQYVERFRQKFGEFTKIESKLSNP